MSAPDEWVCAACGAEPEGNYSIHRDGYSRGPEVDLCDKCGGPAGPTLDQIWVMIRARLLAPVSGEIHD